MISSCCRLVSVGKKGVTVGVSLPRSRAETFDLRSWRDELLAIVGVGPWTADIYLLMALNKPDVWPVGDLALAEAMRRIKGLESRPSGEQQLEIAESWRPWRAVAARIHWHYYLSESS
jgi:DNA-3-methyladenine glycosylase II